jgi:hypothetical protein
MNPPPQLHPAEVQLDVDVHKFEDLFVAVMTH